MTQDRVMLLIDADNVSIDIMEQAVQLLCKQHGGVHVRRAYCTAESAVKHQAAFKRMGIKPMVNLAAGKNSTDIALAVDAIDLVLAERPDVVVIASSDSDFAPLVQRLREKGCEVRGIGQLGKTGQETQEVYDDFTVLEHRKSAEAPEARRSAPRKTAAVKKTAVASKMPAARKAPAAAKKVARKTTARRSAAGAQTDAEPVAEPGAELGQRSAALEAQVAAAFADVVAADAADAAGTDGTDGNVDAVAPPLTAAPPPARPARKRAARKSVEERVAASSASAAEDAAALEAAPAPAATAQAAASTTAATAAAAEPASRAGAGRASLDAVLQCLPELQSGQSLPLNTAVERLRKAQLLGKSSSSLKLFSSWPERFELVPQNRPSVVRLRG